MKQVFSRRNRRNKSTAQNGEVFFKKEGQETFFSEPAQESFFPAPSANLANQSVQRKCDDCEKSDKNIQRLPENKEDEKVQRVEEKKKRIKL